MTSIDTREICYAQFEAMRSGRLADFEQHVHPLAINREATDEPLDCRATGPRAFHATSVMLRSVFAELAWEVHTVAADGDLAACHVTMTGRQVGTFFGYGPDGRVNAAFPPTGREFATTQTHWWRMSGGLLIEHWANRDDLGLARRLGWLPPKPWYLARMALAFRQARRAESRNGGPITGGLRARPAGRATEPTKGP